MTLSESFNKCVPALAGVALAMLVAGCAVRFDNLPQNRPITPEFSNFAVLPPNIPGENIIGLSLSGGGMRAAAFSFGVMQALAVAGTPGDDLFDELSIVSSVSGGSLTGAYMALKGREGLASFRERVLLQDLEKNLRTHFSPTNLSRLMAGGVNDRSNLTRQLDQDIYEGATFADLYRRPQIDLWINATDLYNRTPFPFVPPMFSALCSDLSQFKLSEAVAASMAVPLAFTPVALETFPERCLEPLAPWVEKNLADTGGATSSVVSAAAQAVRNYRDPARMRYIKLVDGGLTDNQGLASMIIVRAIAETPYSPLSERDAVRLRHFLFLIVDAGRPPTGDWGLTLNGPSGPDIAMAAADASVDSTARLSTASFKIMMEAWRELLIGYRCGLPPETIQRYVADPSTWRCDDLRFHIGTLTLDSIDPERAEKLRRIPTRLALSQQDVDVAIEAGHEAALASPALKSYVAARTSERAAR